MSNLDIVRFWKDARYRRRLSPEQVATLPGNPAGPTELSDDELKAAGGLAIGGDVAQTTAINLHGIHIPQLESVRVPSRDYLDHLHGTQLCWSAGLLPLECP